MHCLHPRATKWIEEVVRIMNERQLKPEDSKFMIAFFSSMDNEFVNYFKINKEQISSFSGQNFHIFTPLIYDGNVIPDDEWRTMRKEFIQLGIPLGLNPTFVFFKLLQKLTPNNHGYYPNFFAGFECISFENFPNKLKYAIDNCIEHNEVGFLSNKLSEIFSSKDIIQNSKFAKQFSEVLSDTLPKFTLFISHSSIDKPFVHRLRDELADDQSINFWIDENEILAGDNIQQTITKALQNDCNYLLLVISENSTKSNWVNFELSQFIGFKNGKHIIPIVISKGQKFPEPIENIITTLKYIDFSDETKWQANMLELKKAIQ